MILLESYHNILVDTLKSRIEGDRSDSVLLRISDFDGTIYLLSTLSSNKAILRVSMQLKGFNDLKAYGVDQKMESLFSNYISPEKELGYDVTLQLDFDALSKDPAAFDFVLKHVPQLKNHAMTCIFNKGFEYHTKKETGPVLGVSYREDEGIYVQAMNDRVTVIFAIQFKEDADRVFAKVFLQ
ncbi:Actin- protein 2/3 complex subunit 2, partial [Coelomomyces lativittatus]